MKKILAFLSKPLIIRYKRWNRKTTLSKRQQFVVITFILTIGLITTQVVPPDYRYQMMGGLAILTYISSAFGLRDDLNGVEWLTLLLLPTFFTAAVSLFYFLLPVRWLTRIPIAFLYALGMYALLLTENIYNVAANRTIALLRAAHTVGFLLTLITFFFLVQSILAWHSYAWYNCLAVFVVTFLLSVQSFWSVTLGLKLDRNIILLSFTAALILTEITWVFSFLPVNTTIHALFLTTCYYSVSGMTQQYLQEKLYKKTITEFLSVILIVFIIVLFTTHWRGNI